MADPWAVISTKPLAEDPWAVVSSRTDEPSIAPPPGLPGIPKIPILPPELQQDNRAWLNRPVSDPLVKSVANKTAPGVDMGPTISGVSSMIRGAGRAARNLPAIADPGVPNAPAPGGDFGEFAGGLSDVARGGMEAAMPAMPAAIAAAPLRTAAALATGTAATEGVQAGAEKLGVPQGAAALLGDIAGIGLGGLVGHPALRKMKAAMEEAPRDASQIRTEPEPVAPEPVAPVPAPVARPPQARPIEANPAAAPVDIFDSVQPEGRKGVIQQPAETVSPRASVPQAREIARKEIPLGEETSPEAQANAETQGLLRPVTDQARAGERGAIGAAPPLTPAQQIVRANVAAREKARMAPVRKIRDAVGEMYRDIKAKMVDSLSPVEDMIAAAQKAHGYEIRPEHDFTNQADRVLRARSLAGRFVDENGLAKVIKEVPDLEEFGQYLIAKHARNVEADGFKTGRNPATDAVLISELGPKYEPYAKQIQQFDQKLLDYTVDAGLISRELADQLRAVYPDYVPLNRVFAEIEKPDNLFSAGKGVANLSRQTVIQKLKGSEREIENPLGSLLNKTYAALAQGEKNKAARILAGYKDLPGFEGLINPAKKIRSDATATFSYLDNGKKVTLQTTPEIEAAVKSLDVQNLGTWFKIIAGPARFFKAGTTGVNVPFFLANIARDQQTAFINSKNPIATSVLNQKLFWKSMWDVITHDKSYKEMVDAAAGGSSWDLLRQEPMLTAQKIRSERNLGTKLAYRAHPVKFVPRLWRDFENVLAKSEEYTRLQQFQGTRSELLREGRTPKDAEILAAKAARENTANFSRRGEWGLVLNAAMPYFNASIQGSRAFVRAAGRQPIQTFAKTSLNVLFPVAMVTLWNLSDPEREKAYRDIRKHEKDNAFVIVPPNPTQDDRGRWNVYKFPIAPGVGDLGIPLRRWIEQAHGLDPVKFREVVQAFFGSVSPIEPEWNATLSNVIPQVIKPTVEDAFNRKAFTGAPIVSDNLKKLPAAQQIHPYTSGTARKIAAPMGISPIRVEEFVKGTMGGVGAQALNLSDRALAATGAIPNNQVGGMDTAEATMARFKKAQGGETQSKQFEEKAAAEEKKAAAKQTPNQRLIGSMSLRDAIAQFTKMSPSEQAESRAILQKRVTKAKGIPPYLLPQLKSMGFTVR